MRFEYDKHVDPLELQELCRRFNVELKVTVNKNEIVYHFGEVIWRLMPGYTINYSVFYEISLRLATVYPDRVFNYD